MQVLELESDYCARCGEEIRGIDSFRRQGYHCNKRIGFVVLSPRKVVHHVCGRCRYYLTNKLFGKWSDHDSDTANFILNRNARKPS